MRRFVGTALLAALVVVALPATAGARPTTSPHTFPDFRDDTRRARTDVTAVVVDNGPRITVAVRMRDAIPFTQWGEALSGMAIVFNGKAAMEITRTTSTFGLGGPNTICPVAREYKAAAETYVFSMARSCLRNPAVVRVFVVTSSALPGRADRAPNRGWYNWVARR
jgi:hypothetical protein